MTQSRRLLGAAGEDAAAQWYVNNGYQLLARNWRCREGELDLVLRRGRHVIFAEVKARSSDRFGLPAEAVTRVKQQRIRALAARFLEDAIVSAATVRFDVVSVLAGEVQVYESAF